MPRLGWIGKWKYHLLFEKLIPSRKFVNDFDKNRSKKDNRDGHITGGIHNTTLDTINKYTEYWMKEVNAVAG